MHEILHSYPTISTNASASWSTGAEVADHALQMMARVVPEPGDVRLFVIRLFLDSSPNSFESVESLKKEDLVITRKSRSGCSHSA